MRSALIAGMFTVALAACGESEKSIADTAREIRAEIYRIDKQLDPLEAQCYQFCVEGWSERRTWFSDATRRSPSLLAKAEERAMEEFTRNLTTADDPETINPLRDLHKRRAELLDQLGELGEPLGDLRRPHWTLLLERARHATR